MPSLHAFSLLLLGYCEIFPNNLLYFPTLNTSIIIYIDCYRMMHITKPFKVSSYIKSHSSLIWEIQSHFIILVLVLNILFSLKLLVNFGYVWWSLSVLLSLFFHCSSSRKTSFSNLSPLYYFAPFSCNTLFPPNKNWDYFNFRITLKNT
jgi:hypothetical protein